MPEVIRGEDLARLPLAAGVPAERLQPVAELMRVESAATGEVLGRQGDNGDRFWILLEGSVEVSVISGSHRRVVARAGPGSILGELALLRGRPRTATVKATKPLRFASGGIEALSALLDIGPVRAELQRLASLRLAEDARPVRTTARDGTAMLLRPLLPEDRSGLDDAIRRLSPVTIRRRFFSASAPSEAVMEHLVNIDYVDHFAWLALDAERRAGVATARYIRRTEPTEAEVALTISDEYQGRGIGTLMVGALGVAAVEAGIETLVAHVLEENAAMRSVFAKAKAHSAFDEPGLLFVTMAAADCADLLLPPLGAELGSAVREIVTAASLAMARRT